MLLGKKKMKEARKVGRKERNNLLIKNIMLSAESQTYIVQFHVYEMPRKDKSTEF